MIEILIILGVVVLIIWCLWNFTDISGRLAKIPEHFTGSESEQEKLNESDICGMEGVKTIYTKFEPLSRTGSPPFIDHPHLAVPLGTPDLPNRVENEGLGYECISDAPFFFDPKQVRRMDRPQIL